MWFFNSKGGLGCLIILLVVGFVAFFLCAIEIPLTPEQKAAQDTEKAENDERSAAWEMAEHFVSVFLKYPDDSEFLGVPDFGRTEPIDGIRHWGVTGKVKAANAFGIKLTHTYFVELYKKGDKWYPRAVKIDGKEVVFRDEPPAEPTLTRTHRKSWQTRRCNPFLTCLFWWAKT